MLYVTVIPTVTFVVLHDLEMVVSVRKRGNTTPRSRTGTGHISHEIAAVVAQESVVSILTSIFPIQLNFPQISANNIANIREHKFQLVLCIDPYSNALIERAKGIDANRYLPKMF